MKKFLLTLLVAVLGMTAAQAQIVKGLEYPRAHFGARAAFTSSNWSVDGKSADAFPFVSGGLAADFRIAPIPLYLETGTYYVDYGFKYGKDTQYSGTYENSSVLVPLLVSYHLYFNDNMAIQPFLGAYGAYSLDTEEIDAGIRVGCGFNYGRLYANIGYDFGMMAHDYDAGYGYYIEDCKISAFFFTIGFNFVGSY